MIDLNIRALEVHEANKKWWTSLETGEPIKRNIYELEMLIISELSECLEGIRKNLMDDKLPHRKMEEVEMADAYIRILDYCAGLGKNIKPSVYAINHALMPANKAEALFSIVFDITHNNIEGALAKIISYCQCHSLDLEGAYYEKMAYNATRVDHTHEARKLINGKKI